jgi:hypothetical protein
MIVSIMQPYFFPYIGYFQLMVASDVFVGFDNVQYTRRGWVHRNRTLDARGNAVWHTLPVAAADHRLNIRERKYVLTDGSVDRILRRLENAYRKAPHFQTNFPLIEEILRRPEPNVAEFNMGLLRLIADRLGIRKRFAFASELPDLECLSGEARVIAICERLGASRYVNPIGGRGLYHAAHFQARGVSLGFLETRIEPHPGQHPYLSIIHTLMTESDDAIADLLARYSIVAAD